MNNFRLSLEYLREANRTSRDNKLVLSDLFTPFPEKFGLRGDPYLWGMMAARLNYSWLNEDEDEPLSLEGEIKRAFRELTGQNWDDAPDEFQVEALNHGGMSGGWISMDWWRRTGLPLLRDRFDAADVHLRNA
ncbi:hypothetical protein [Roseobacter sp. MED193]|uniref:hypothetical protein n=1 Tax=Roseobacter sp. MED193 TaxID=314262 RepID=UPI00032542C4|nr:hypothetical protein [Roseobacter sp. MED193]